MSDEKTVTERDAVLRERRAYQLGAVEWVREERAILADVEAKARQRYPLPKVPRARIVVDGNGEAWRIEDGEIHRKPKFGDWRLYHAPASLALLADLLANPTELFDEDDSPVSPSGSKT